MKTKKKLDDEGKNKILVVDDDEAILKLIKKNLEKDGFEVVTAPDGTTAQSLFSMDKFAVVVSDLHMPGRISGIELFRFVRDINNTPFILITDFATAAKRQEAADLGINGFLPKPFRHEDLQKVLKSLCPIIQEGAAGESDQDENFSKMAIDDFISGRKIQYSIFIRLSKSNYVKIANEGEELPAEQIRAYKEKGIRHLHLLHADFQKYMNFNLGLAHTVKGSKILNDGKKTRLIKHTGEVILEHIFLNDVNQGIFEDARNIVDVAISYLTNAPDTFDLLEALNTHSDALYAHSLGVSIYASMIAKTVEWNSPQTLYKVSIAGLLHDIGKKEIDRLIYEKSRNDMTREDLKIMETHAVRGAEILAGVPSIPSDVIQIILHHHERDFGTGYPARLTKNKTHPMARLIAVADEFCMLAIKNPTCPGLPPREAIQRLQSLFGGTLEPSFIQALMKVFNITLESQLR